MTQILNARAARTRTQTLTAESSIFKNTLKAKPLRNTAKINQDPDARESSQPGDMCWEGNAAHKPRTKDPETDCHGLVHNVERGGQKEEIKKLDLGKWEAVAGRRQKSLINNF